MTWDDDYDPADDYEEDPAVDFVTCIACCCVIGDEVAYGDNWGEGPLCTRCAGMEDVKGESE
jgi:hypothetical protein